MTNIDSLKRGFMASQLPQNFQDAISVADRLGIQYVWIDSLCIVQDSVSDWIFQSSLMSAVYGSSYFTIYASDAGFLRPRSKASFLEAKVCQLPGSGDWIYARYPRYENYVTGRLWERGWAFQELILPSRVLEYSPSYIRWYCNSGILIETAPDLTTSSLSRLKNKIARMNQRNQKPFEHLPYATWYELVQSYSRRKLDKDSDKLPAVAGLANLFFDLLNDQYLAGLWKKDLAAGICWRKYQESLQEPAYYTAPSWSWASKIGPVDFTFTALHNYTLEVADYSTYVHGRSRFGQVKGGYLTVKGPMRTFKIPPVTADVYGTEKNHTGIYGPPKLHSKIEENATNHCHFFEIKTQENFRNSLGTGICTFSFDVCLPADLPTLYLFKLKKEGIINIKKAEFAGSPDGLVLRRYKHEDDYLYTRIGVYQVADLNALRMASDTEYTELRGWVTETITIV
ncbi:HET-domain-containing protein [Microthyrium microscopicum]|uniref:HET-domain-containing protein n=1 Tax=Microthyrium microscopicum TaxID=703497 RepID=A0A6A6UDV4_9PEZI|nr:HET-domain-containing protein [Microthyrium microscopicum]